MGMLSRSRIVCLGQLIDIAGPALTDSHTLSTVLGVRSVRLAQKSLELWKRKPTEREREREFSSLNITIHLYKR